MRLIVPGERMDDLVSDFVIEAAEGLAALQSGLAALSLRGGDPAPVSEMLTRLHGLKGLFGFAGFSRAEAVAHAAESLLVRVQRDGVPPASVVLALLGEAIQRLGELIGAAARSGEEPAGHDHPLIAALELAAGVAQGGAQAPRPGPTAPAEPAPQIQPDAAGRRVRPPWSGLDTLARALGDRLGKRIDLSAGGDDVRVAVRAAAPLRTALIALVRNACDHGIETPAERRAAGKPVLAMLELTVRRHGEGVAVDVVDDGRGIDPQRLRERSVALGLEPASAARLDDAAAQRLVFSPGVTTAGELSALSGRGLGLDLVRREIQALGGEVEMSSTPGRGSRFTLILPASALATAASRRLAAA